MHPLYTLSIGTPDREKMHLPKMSLGYQSVIVHTVQSHIHPEARSALQTRLGLILTDEWEIKRWVIPSGRR